MSDTLIAGSQATPQDSQQSAGTQGQQAQQQHTTFPEPGQGQQQQQAADSASQQQSPATSQQQTAQPAQPQQQAYDLKLPQGSSLDAAHLDEVKAMAKELGLSQEAAQRLVERDNALLSKSAEQNQAMVSEKVSQWAEQAKADKEIGGVNLQSSITDAKTALDRFGTPEFKGMLNQSGVGNHPELIRLLSKVGKAMREDKMVTGSSKPVQDHKSFADAFYPGMAKSSD